MYRIVENKDKKLVAVGRFGEEAIHVIHCGETLEELVDDIANLYLVAEEATNFARIHLVSNFSQDNALEQVADYLREEENINEPDFIGVFDCSL